MPRLVTVRENRVSNLTLKTARETFKVARFEGESEGDQSQQCDGKLELDCTVKGCDQTASPDQQDLSCIQPYKKQHVLATQRRPKARYPRLGARPQQSLSPFGSIEAPALRAFEFYINLTARDLGGAFNRRFFTITLPQLMQNNAAVKHSVLALAGFHENFMFGERTVHGHQQKVNALNHYNTSIHNVVKLHQSWSSESKVTILVTCLLFCAIENVQGHFKSCVKHIAAGLQLLEADTAESPSSEDDQSDMGICSNMIRSLLTNLSTHAMIIDEIDIDLQSTQSLLQRSSLAASQPVFSTIEEALNRQSYLFNDTISFLSWAHQMQQSPDFPSEPILQFHAELNQRYILWIRAFRNLVAAHTESRSIHENSVRAALLLLRLNQRVIDIIITSPWDVLRETIDGHTDEFRAIVREATEFLEIESSNKARRKNNGDDDDNDRTLHDDTGSISYSRSFSMIMGIVPALYFTSTECRERATQDQAMHLLATCRRRESVWDSTIFSAIAERLVLIKRRNAIRYWEQQGHTVALDPAEPQALQDIPLSARIADLRVDYYGADDVVRVSTISISGLRKEIHHLIWNGAAEDGHYRPLGWTSKLEN